MGKLTLGGILLWLLINSFAPRSMNFAWDYHDEFYLWESLQANDRLEGEEWKDASYHD